MKNQIPGHVPSAIADLMTGVLLLTAPPATASVRASAATREDSATAVTRASASIREESASGSSVSTVAERRIVISVADRKLVLIDRGRVARVYSVAVGKTSTPSPTGTFAVTSRVQNPTYYRPGVVIEPGPRNPLGTRWIGLSRTGYGIHGTNEPGSIGKAASHGCIRMAQSDLEQLYEIVRVGDVVEIVSDVPAAMAAASFVPSVGPSVGPTDVPADN